MFCEFSWRISFHPTWGTHAWWYLGGSPRLLLLPPCPPGMLCLMRGPLLWPHVTNLAGTSIAEVAARLLCPWTLPGKNTGVGCHYFSRGSSQPRDQIWFSCIAGRSFTIWVTRENLFRKYSVLELILTFPGNNLIIHQTLCHCKLCVRVDYRGFWPYKEIILNIQFTQDTVREIRKLRKR